MINVSGGNAGKWQHIGCDKVKIFLSILLFIRWWNLIYIICIQFLQGEHNIHKIRLYIHCIKKKSDVRFLPGFCGRLRFCLWKATNMLRKNVKKASVKTLKCANCCQEWKSHMEDILNSIFPSLDLVFAVRISPFLVIYTWHTLLDTKLAPSSVHLTKLGLNWAKVGDLGFQVSD